MVGGVDSDVFAQLRLNGCQNQLGVIDTEDRPPFLSSETRTILSKKHLGTCSNLPSAKDGIAIKASAAIRNLICGSERDPMMDSRQRDPSIMSS